MSAMCEVKFDILTKFESLTSAPEVYLSSQPSVSKKLRRFIKKIYDLTKSEEFEVPKFDALPELIIKNFDEEQIWQQLELQNVGQYKKFISDVAYIISDKDNLTFPIKLQVNNPQKFEEEEEDHELEEVNQQSVISGDDDSERSSDEFDEESDNVEFESKKKVHNPSEVDDDFFKLSEMEEFLKKQELNEVKHDGSDEDDIYFDEIEFDEDDDEKHQKREHYADFFDPPTSDYVNADIENKTKKKIKKKKVSFADEDESDPEEIEMEDEKKNVSEEPKSSFEVRQERLNKKIQKLEDEAIADKPWQLKGEVIASARPQNSLLEEILDFDVNVRPAPVITKETTEKLEDVISQRIKDQSWDDVERKIKPVETTNEYKKRLVLDQSKSKLSLAEIYEQEFVKKRDESGVDPREKEDEERPEEKEIKVMMSSLFTKLDALSNFHYTPKQVAPEVKIVSNLPAITMEEVAPVSVSDATLLAPEEITMKRKGESVNKSERTPTDKKRERRKKKAKQSEQKKYEEKRDKIVNKLNPGLGNKYSKIKAQKMIDNAKNQKQIIKVNEGKAIKSSKAFFQHLQDDVNSMIKSAKEEKRKSMENSMSAKKLKL